MTGDPVSAPRRLVHAALNVVRRLAAKLGRDRPRRGRSASRSAALPPAAAIHPFDLVHGVDTSGFVAGAALRSAHRNSSWSTAYYAIAPSIFEAVLARLAPAIAGQWHRFSFVDLGSGKGRALLLAGRLPFAEVLGVELNPELSRISERNIRRFLEAEPLPSPARCATIDVRNEDATEVAYPLTPLIVYLYHPFQAPVLRRALFHLRRSLRDHPREAWILYINAEAADVFRHFPELRRVWEQTFEMAPADVLADRTDSTEEHVVAFHYTPRTSRD